MKFHNLKFDNISFNLIDLVKIERTVSEVVQRKLVNSSLHNFCTDSRIIILNVITTNSQDQITFFSTIDLYIVMYTAYITHRSPTFVTVHLLHDGGWLSADWTISVTTPFSFLLLVALRGLADPWSKQVRRDENRSFYRI